MVQFNYCQFVVFVPGYYPGLFSLIHAAGPTKRCLIYSNQVRVRETDLNYGRIVNSTSMVFNAFKKGATYLLEAPE